MAREFKVGFEFHNKMYEATVTIADTQEDNTICVEVPATQLKQVVPEGKFKLNGETGAYLPDERQPAIDPQLVQSIWKKIEQHESESQEASMW